MTFDQGFSIASTAAMAGWLLLILLPRFSLLMRGLQTGLIGALSVAYAALIFVYFFSVENGGFGSIAEVRALFMSDGVLLAGWIHYLAFDLFVGMWIAREADRIGMNRILQAPILLATFMFGPIGFLIFLVSQTLLAAMPAGRSAT